MLSNILCVYHCQCQTLHTYTYTLSTSARRGSEDGNVGDRANALRSCAQARTHFEMIAVVRVARSSRDARLWHGFSPELNVKSLAVWCCGVVFEMGDGGVALARARGGRLPKEPSNAQHIARSCQCGGAILVTLASVRCWILCCRMPGLITNQIRANITERAAQRAYNDELIANPRVACRDALCCIHTRRNVRCCTLVHCDNGESSSLCSSTPNIMS